MERLCRSSEKIYLANTISNLLRNYTLGMEHSYALTEMLR